MKWTVLIVALALGGCRGETDDTPPPVSTPHPDARPGASSPDAPTQAVSGTVKAILMSPPGKDEVISIQGAIVVGSVKSSSRVTLFIQDKNGGPQSGIQVYCPKNGCTQYDTLGSVKRGAVVDVSAKFTVYQGEPELQFATVTDTGKTGTPTFVDVDPADVQATADVTASAFQKWIGVAVKLKGQLAVTDVTADAFKTTCPNKMPGDYYPGFEGAVGTTKVDVGFSLYNVVGWCIPGCGLECTQPVEEGMAFSKVEGIVRVLNGKASVDPYLPDDMVVGGTQPPGPDAGAASEPDAGVVTKGDAPLPAADAAPADAPIATGGTVASVAQNPPADGTAITLGEVVVVGNELRSSGALVYVQDRGGGAYSGLEIFCSTPTCRPALEGLQPGDVIGVSGSFKAYKSNGGTTLELGEPLTVTPSATPAAPVAARVPASILAAAPDSTDFAPYNGVYVEIAATALVTSAHVVEFDSGSCAGSQKFANAFAVSVGGVDGYVYAFFNDSLSLCVSGGCASCFRAVAPGQTFPYLRGVLQTQTFHPDGGLAVAKVVLAPVEDLDVPAPGSVRALLAGAPTAGDPVTLTQVVVVAHNAMVGHKSANLFVQDPGGGRYSGMQIYCDKTKDGAASCVDDILALVPGDVIDVQGSYDVYQSLTPEVVVPTAIVKSGTTADLVYATPAVPDVAAAAGSADGTAISTHFAPYNQVLVKVMGPASVASVAVADLYSTCGAGLDDWKGFSVDVGASTLYVGDLFADAGMSLCQVDQCDNTTCANEVQVGQSYDYVEGVARFSKNAKVQLAPRSMADVPASPTP
jgi:hypothetical protein